MSEIKFRVHTTAGHFDVWAKTPKDAADQVRGKHPAVFVKKVKIVKEDA